MTDPTIDPGVITLIQSNFLEQITAAFSTTALYASNLLYLFAALELTVLGLVWALQREVGWDKLFFKIIKIGLIFFIIQNYTWLLSTILDSFAQLAGTVIRNSSIAQFVFNPAKIWQYGYDVGVHMLQLAANSNLFGLTMIQVGLGVGILLVFGLLGIQMVLQIVGFYLISFGSLILLPFGALTLGRNMLDKAVQAVLKAGLRLMTLIIIIGVAVITWDEFQLTDLATTTNFNLNQPLGLFFTALLFLCLAVYLPKVISEAVGDLSSAILESGPPSVVVTTREAAPMAAPTVIGGVPNIQAATTITPGAGGGVVYAGGEGVAAATKVAPAPTVSVTTTGGLDTKATREAMVAQASVLSKSISESTVKKIKESVLKAMTEKTKK